MSEVFGLILGYGAITFVTYNTYSFIKTTNNNREKLKVVIEEHKVRMEEIKAEIKENEIKHVNMIKRYKELENQYINEYPELSLEERKTLSYSVALMETEW
jgi:predicted membrane protein